MTESYDAGEPVNFQITLRSNGAVEFNYGTGNSSLSPTIGMSAGDGVHYTLSTLNGCNDMSNAETPAVRAGRDCGAGLVTLASQLPTDLVLDASSPPLLSTE